MSVRHLRISNCSKVQYTAPMSGILSGSISAGVKVGGALVPFQLCRYTILVTVEK